MENCCSEVFVQRICNDRKFCPRGGLVIFYFAGRTFLNDSEVYGMTLGVWLRQSEELFQMRQSGNSLGLEGGEEIDHIHVDDYSQDRQEDFQQVRGG